MKAGGAYLPLDGDYPDSRLHYMVQDSKAKYIITDENYAPRFRTLKIDMIKANDTAVNLLLPNQLKLPELNCNNIAYVIYTSGSTGKPKGVLVQHKGLSNLAIQHSHNFSITPDSKMLQFSSFSFDASVLEFCTTLSSGATLVIAERDDLLGDNLVKTMNKLQITISMPSPSLLALLHEPVIPSLKTLVLGGECTAPSTIKYWLTQGVNVINSYGPTETSVCACFYSYNINEKKPWNTIGKPFKGVEVYILDKDKSPVPTGVPGQLYIGGIGVSLGYLNQPELTADKFVEITLDKSVKKQIYATGDLVKQLPCENIEYLGRIDNQIKIRGFRIELGEIEALVNSEALVCSSAAVMQEKDNDKFITVFVILENKADIPSVIQKIKISLKEYLPSFMIPRHILPIEAFPLTLNGKIDRKSLANMEIKEQHVTSQSNELKPYEKVIVNTFRQVLNTQKINKTDNFFQQGGHSLTAIQVMHEINTYFSQSLTWSNRSDQPS